MSAEIVVLRRSSAFVKTTARQVDRRYNKFKRLLAAADDRGYRNPNARNSLHGEHRSMICVQSGHSVRYPFQRVTNPLDVQARALCSIRATLTRANLRAARRNYSCRMK
jgi:hypothetical protein